MLIRTRAMCARGRSRRHRRGCRREVLQGAEVPEDNKNISLQDQMDQLLTHA